MLNLDPAKLVVILVIALVVLGPERLPQHARRLGAMWHEFTRVRAQLTDEVRSALPDLEVPKIPYRAGALTSLLRDEVNRVAAPRTEPVAPEQPPPDGSAPARAPEDLTRSARPPSAPPGGFGVDDPGMN